jgi:hypothetical protein
LISRPIDFSNFEKINEEAYVWHNFLDDQICDEAFDESWELSQRSDKHVRVSDQVELLGGAMHETIVNKINNFFDKTDYEIRYFLHWYTAPGVWFGIHRDDEAADKTPFKKAWGGVIYLAEMQGGELFYPTNNTWMQPHKGDLVLHTAGIPHGATAVTTDNKRTITFVVYDKNHIVDPEKEMTEQELYDLRHEQVRNSFEWHNSDMGKRWKERYNIKDWNDYGRV